MFKFLRKGAIFLFAFSVISLVSCGPEKENVGPGPDPDINEDDKKEDNYIPSLISPTGAPTLPAYKLLLSEKVEANTVTDATTIPAYFSSGNSDFIIFDSTNAQKLLNKAGENAKYEFVQMLTGGNFHLLGFDKTEEDVPANDDTIYGFMSQSTPGILFRNIYGSDMVFDQAFNGIAELQTSLLTMKNYEIAGTKIDWAVVAEPANTALQSKLKANGNTNILDINLNAAFKEKHKDEWNKDYICQAGLFVKKEFKEEHPEVYESTISLLQEGINALFTDLDSAFNEMTSGELSDANKFQAKFGFNSGVIKGVQGTNSSKNGFGVVPNDVKFTVGDINKFNSLTA